MIEYVQHSLSGPFDEGDFGFMVSVMESLAGAIQIEPEYLAHVRLFNGGVPVKRCAPVSWLGYSGVSYMPVAMLHYSRDYEGSDWSTIVSCAWTQATDGGGMDKKLWPIARFQHGDLLCFDFRVRSCKPPVVAWLRDFSEVGNTVVSQVSESFSELSTLLREESDEDDDE